MPDTRLSSAEREVEAEAVRRAVESGFRSIENTTWHQKVDTREALAAAHGIDLGWRYRVFVFFGRLRRRWFR